MGPEGMCRVSGTPDFPLSGPWKPESPADWCHSARSCNVAHAAQVWWEETTGGSKGLPCPYCPHILNLFRAAPTQHPWAWLPPLLSNLQLGECKINIPFLTANWALSLLGEHSWLQSLQISVHKSLVSSRQPQSYLDPGWEQPDNL